MKIIFAFLFCFTTLSLFSQEKPNFELLDSLYREDQFYASLTYNKIINKPNEYDQKKFAPSFSFGFLRDFPINKRRTYAIAAGLGYSINNYNQNLFVSSNSDIQNYTIISPNINYEKNKLILHYVEIPVEFRWRNSTKESHKFWRVYAGFKLGYLTYDRAKYVDDSGTIAFEGNQDLNRIQYGTYITFGYNTWNFYTYYGLNPIFKTGTLNNENIKIQTLNFGLMFYIL